MKNEDLEKTRSVLAEDMKKYVEIILNEYGSVIPQERQQFLREINNYSSRISFEDRGTISMLANKKGVIFPIGAYKIFNIFKWIPGYGSNKNHKISQDVINGNTYSDYIKHVFLSGYDVEYFYRDTLLHETLHFCGSGGVNALREGFNELKTRELAKKYGLIANYCGYSKEVEIADRFQKIVGLDIGNRIAFARNNKAIDELLQENCGDDIADLFFEISDLMDKECKEKYSHSKFGGIFGPFKKARAYSKIDYSNIYEKLRMFEEKKMLDGNIQRNSFVEEIKVNGKTNSELVKENKAFDWKVIEDNNQLEK